MSSMGALGYDCNQSTPSKPKRLRYVNSPLKGKDDFTSVSQVITGKQSGTKSAQIYSS